ncbi:MAG TPA: hypothetical protein H9689_07630 [Firmicutes bacterium]|nr:hypothetical protein [Bacillota bacterium]
MTRKRIAALFTAVIFMFLMSVSAMARASDQISAYAIDVTPLSGEVEVYFYVSGTGVKDKLGCESIYVYEVGNVIPEESWDEYDSGMARRNGAAYGNSIYFDSEKGVEYKVVVTIFAEDDDGRDSRSKTFYVTGE